MIDDVSFKKDIRVEKSLAIKLSPAMPSWDADAVSLYYFSFFQIHSDETPVYVGNTAVVQLIFS